MAPLSSCGAADKNVSTRGCGPPSMRRKPSAWSKSKLAKVSPARFMVAGGCLRHQQRQFSVGILGSSGVALELECPVDQVATVAQVQVFRHALAIRDIKQIELLADYHVEHIADRGGFIEFGHDATGQAA